VKGTNATRVVRLISHFIQHPNDIPRYLKISIKAESTPLNLGLPWISYSAIDFLEGFIKPNHEIAEFGGGGSTIFFAKRAQKVLCMESNDIWAERIKNKLSELDYKNVQVLIYPYDAMAPESFIDTEYYQAIGEGKFDVILIDAYDEFRKIRGFIFHKAENLIKENGCIVVDDSWRYTELRENNRAKRWKEFRSIGPGRTGITTTDIYFY